MARKNKLGTPYLGLNLSQEEEKWLRKFLADEDVSAKQLMRYLLRSFMKEKGLKIEVSTYLRKR